MKIAIFRRDLPFPILLIGSKLNFEQNISYYFSTWNERWVGNWKFFKNVQLDALVCKNISLWWGEKIKITSRKENIVHLSFRMLIISNVRKLHLPRSKYFWICLEILLVALEMILSSMLLITSAGTLWCEYLVCINLLM